MREVLLFVCLLMAGMTVNVNAAKQKAKHVILIGMDGWGAYSVPKADIPAIKSLMANGCYTLHSRSVLPSSSAINWASMFMGVGTELHGYTTWGSKTPEIPSREVHERGIAPTIFSVLREQRPKAEIGCLYEWPGIKYLVDTLAMSYQYQTPGYAKAPTALCEAAEKYIIEKKPELLAICFEEPDHTGHTKGHDTPAYYQMLKELDGYVERILQAIKKAGIWDDTIIIMTADHGGIKTGHGGKTLREMEIPFIISGKNVRKGMEIKESMMQYDTAAMIAYILGLKQPQSWIGRPVKTVFK